MRLFRIGSALGLAWMFAVSGALAVAQTDLAVSGFEAFNTSTRGNGTVQNVSNGPGGMVEFRQIRGPLFGYGASFSFGKADETVSPEVGNCGFRCANPTERITANASQLGLHWVVSDNFGAFTPFALAGLGFYIATPTSNQYYLNTIVRPAYEYGGGVDWCSNCRIGVRLQIRGSAYKAPDIAGVYNPTGAYAQTFQPMVGVFFRTSAHRSH